jgi:hypothetical protein
MEIEYKRQRNSKGELYTKWIIRDGKNSKSGSCKTDSQAIKRVNKILNTKQKQ